MEDDPKFFSSYSLTRLAQGAALGFVITLIGGFGFGGWYSGGGAMKLASTTADSAVNKALTPFCVAAFNASATPEQKAELKGSPSYAQTSVVRKVVKLPGIDTLDYTLASNCADAVVAANAKSAEK